MVTLMANIRAEQRSLLPATEYCVYCMSSLWATELQELLKALFSNMVLKHIVDHKNENKAAEAHPVVVCL